MHELHDAAERGSLEEVTNLLKSIDINSKDPLGDTPLHRAALAGSLEVAQHLMKNGAVVDAVNKKQRTPLHYALKCRENAVSLYLLECGADIKHTDDQGNDALHVACEATFDYFIIEAILKRGADIESRNNEDWTPLLQCASSSSWVGVADMIDTLVEYGANVNPRIMWIGKEYSNPTLYTACGTYESLDFSMKGGNDVVLALLDYGCGDVPCSHGDTTELMCTLRLFTETPSVVECFERHFIKMSIARIRYYEENPQLPRVPEENPRQSPEPEAVKGEWSDEEKRSFCHDCKLELEKMKREKVKGTNVSYSNLFYLKPLAYRSLKSCNVSLNWEEEDFWKCLELFPIYGRLLYHRYKRGVRRVPLLEQCYAFFPVPGLPELPMECVDEILSYLDETDLTRLGECCFQLGLQNNAATQRFSKLSQDQSPD